MVASRDATLNLSALLRNAPGSVDEVADQGELLALDEQLLADLVRVAGPLSWSLRVTGTGGDDDFVVTGRVAGTAVMECRRCLTEVPTDVDVSFVYPMVHRPGAEPALELIEGEEDDVLVFAQPEVDFAPLLTQLFAIDLPLTALCRADCRGLSVEGVDLNIHPEAADRVRREERRSPFDPLKDLEL